MNECTRGRLRALPVALSCVMALSGCAPASESSTVPASPSRVEVSASVLDTPPETAFDGATLVLRGRVTGRGSTVTIVRPSGDDRTPGSTTDWLYTEWNVAPTRIYKSDGQAERGKPVRVALRGGARSDLVMEYPGEATFTTGEDVVLFLTTSDGEGTAAVGRYFVYAMAEGKYSVNANGIAVNRSERRTIPIKDLESRLR